MTSLPFLDLPADAPRSTQRNASTGRLAYVVDPPLCAQLRTLAAAEQVSVRGLFATAVLFVYARYLRGTDAVLGMAGRELRAGVDGDARFSTRLRALRADLGHDHDADAELGTHDLVWRYTGSQVTVEYDRDVYSADRIDRLWGHVVVLLRAVVADVDVDVTSIDLLSHRERELLLSFAGKRLHVPADASVHGAVEARARQRPDAVAVECARSGATISYRQLNQRANRLAHHLVELGLGAERPAVLLMERGPALVTAILATWKASGYYVPLDVRDPRARLRDVLRDVGGGVLVVQDQADLVDLDLDPAAYRVVVLADAADALGRQPSTDLSRPFDPRRLAYGIFTSGSTGRPKAALVEHRGMLNHIHAKIAELDLTETVVIAQTAPHTFDISVWQQLTALVVGGRTVIFDRELVNEPARLVALVAERRVQLLQLVPSYLATLLDEHDGRAIDLPHLTLLLTIGEALPASTAARWFGRAPHVPLLNTYGPTEASDVVTHHMMRRAPQGAVPIGRPIANTTVYILDERLRACPPGIAGEICVAGHGVGRGYLGRPELTEAAFVRCDALGRGAERLYRTGDLGRFDAQGQLEYLGRIDHQIKLRGFRVELGEVEHQLALFPGVRAVVVVARPRAHGDLELCAYVAGPRDLAPLRLRAHLEARLPEYMVPTRIAIVDALPLTANGKIDRRRLPDIEEAAGAAAHGALEARVAELWARVLKREHVPADRDFLSLGGTSLLAIKLVSMLRRELGADLTLADFLGAPTVARVAAQIAGKLGDRPTDSAAHPSEPLPAERHHPPSHVQRQLWFLHQLDPSAAQYNISIAVEVRGALDLLALPRAVAETIERHAILRTTFVESDGILAQTVHDTLDGAYAYADLRAIPATERREEALRVVDREAQYSFDLQRGPLFRTVALQLDHAHFVLIATLHHIIADGWSVGLLIDDLSRHYLASGSGGERSALSPRAQYTDFARRQSVLLEGQARASLLDFWRDHLRDAPLTIDLPTDHPRPEVPSAAGALHTFVVPSDLATALGGFAAAHEATPFMTLIAAFGVLLHRYSGQTDLVIGTPFANRLDDDFIEVLGNFVHTLPIRISVDPDQGLDALVAQVRARTLRVLAHQALPFDELVEALAPPRTLGRNPLFQVLFVYQEQPESPVEVPGLVVSRVESDHTTSKFDLTLTMGLSEAGLEGSFEFSTDLYARETIEAMARHFLALLAAAAAEPARPVRALDMFSAEERRRLLDMGRQPPGSGRTWPSVPSLFREIVAARPDSVALVTSTQTLSYRELDQRSDHLARRLQAQLPRAARVGVHLEPSPEFVIALLAVLKVGAAYVPLDLANPPARLRQILDDARPHLVITDRAHRPALGEQSVLELDDGLEPPEAATELPLDLSGDTPAYIMYTSGSTGSPKGVCIPHRGIARLVRGTNYITVSPDHVFYMLAPTTFDASTLEIWGSLLNGATLVVRESERPSIDEIARTLRQRRVTVLWLTTGLFNLIVDEDLECLRGVQVLLTGGDVASPSHVRRALDALPGCTVINGYGPTENTTFSTCHRVARDHPTDRALPIGIPVSGTDVYILDELGQPVPRGVVGELWVGGAGVGLGYWSNAELTAERFVHDHLGGGSLLYRTGDRARFSPAGVVDFLGRADAQVKVRGYRIELGEIEAALREHEAVRDAAVRVWPAKRGSGRQIVAYALPREGSSPTAVALRAHLQRRLPDYMVPAAVILMTELPLNVSGKVDRHLLPEASAPSAGDKGQLVAPRTLAERALCEAWAKALGVPEVSCADDVQELGADSIVALRATMALHREGWACEPSTLLRETSIPRAAQHLVRVSVPAPLRGAAPRLPLTPGQASMLVHSVAAGSSELYCQHLLIPLHGAVDPAECRRALEALVRRHKALRASFALRDDGVGEQQFAEHVETPFVHEDVSGLSTGARTERLDALIEADRRRGFDVSRAPLFLFRLFTEGPSAHRLMIVHHHLLFDGWSVSILIGDFLRLYRGEALDTEVADLDLYARWHQETAQPAALERFWRQELSGLGEPTTLRPGARPPEVRPFAHRSCARMLGIDETTSVRQFARAHGLTPATLFQGALAYVLSRYSGLDEVVFGVTVAGRSAACPRSDEIVGLLVNTLPLRLTLALGDRVVTWLSHIQDKLGALRRHESVSHQQLRAWIGDGSSPGVSRLFDCVFVFENYPGVSGDDGAPLRAGALEFAVPIHTTLLYAVPHGGDVELKLDYDGNEWSTHESRTLLDLLRQVVLELVAHGDRTLADLRMAAALPHAQLAATATPPRTVYEAFAWTAARTPDAIAIEDHRAQLTYREVDAQARALAASLAQRGVRRGSRVGVAIERSPQSVVALLALARLGACFVPIDLSAPQARQDAQAADADLQLIVRRADVDGAPVPEADAATVSMAECADLPAYIIYTSGSTGVPKGVVVRHRSLAHYTLAAVDAYRLGPSDRVLQFAAITFDACLEEIFPTLAAGGTLVLRTDDMLDSFPRFTSYCRDRRITVLDLPTAFWRSWMSEVDAVADAIPPTVRLVIIGGEAAYRASVERWQAAAAPHQRLVNTYGPTETTIVATMFEVTRDAQPHASAIVPIGRPVRGTRVSVRDHWGTELPSGVPGELWIGGAGVAEGYFGRPHDTAQRFTPDGWYRSGDRVALRADGDLLFIGRVDDAQVKINGFRVELAEIESALAGHPDVSGAAARLFTALDGSGASALVAYVCERAPSTGVERYREFLRERLPHYMIPQRVVVLDRLPLTSSGKLDRLRLPPPPAATGPATQAPTAMEDLLVSVLGDCLRRPLAVDDNFFERGGNSVLATTAMSRLRAALSVDLTVRLLFEAPTARALSARLLAGGHAPLRSASCLVPLKTARGGPTLVLLPGVFGAISYLSPLAHALPARCAVLALRSPGLDGGVLPDTIDDLAGLYCQALREAQPIGPYYLAGHSFGATVALAMARRLVADGAQVGHLFVLDGHAPSPGSQVTALEDELRSEFSLAMRAFLGQPGQDPAADPHPPTLEVLAVELRAAGVEVTIDQLARYYAVFRGHLSARPPTLGAPVPVTTTVIRAQDTDAPADGGWAALIDGPVEHLQARGDHFTMLEPPHLDRLATWMGERIR